MRPFAPAGNDDLHFQQNLILGIIAFPLAFHCQPDSIPTLFAFYLKLGKQPES